MMEWKDTETYKCRWSEAAEEAFNSPKVIWENSYADYQGNARFFGWTGAAVVFYEWSYGSCSGCDPWEDVYGGSEGQEKLAALMRGGAVWFDTMEPLLIFAEPWVRKGKTDWSNCERNPEQGQKDWEAFVKEVEELLK